MKSELLTDQMARTAYEVNRAYAAQNGDLSFKPWDEADQWQKDTIYAGVNSHLSGTVSPEQSHQLWWDHKIKEGWVYGEVKDPEKKTHPCMVPYEDLPPFQRTKDHLFKAVIDSFIKGQLNL
jgi:hypothetical protein